jgi:chromatin remodeling complex protein RSC6
MNSPTHATIEDSEPSIPGKLQKISSKMNELTSRIGDHKKETANLYAEMKSLERMFEKYTDKITKEQAKQSSENRKRKPSGFACPTAVSAELSSFMGRPVGELISRTETSKFLTSYIQTNGLRDPRRKNVILLDEPLSRLLGEDAVSEEVTYFTIQKYMNRHFRPPPEDAERSSLSLSKGI